MLITSILPTSRVSWQLASDWWTLLTRLVVYRSDGKRTPTVLSCSNYFFTTMVVLSYLLALIALSVPLRSKAQDPSSSNTVSGVESTSTTSSTNGAPIPSGTGGINPNPCISSCLVPAAQNNGCSGYVMFSSLVLWYFIAIYCFSMLTPLVSLATTASIISVYH